MDPATDPAADPVRVVHHVHRSGAGDVVALCSGRAAEAWSPRPLEGVLTDLRDTSARHVVSWLGGRRPVVTLPLPQGGHHLHSTHPSGAGNALDTLPPCPVHVDPPPPGGPHRRGTSAQAQAARAASRARHPSNWPPVRPVPPV